jgi:ArsR family transcriptional regulator
MEKFIGQFKALSDNTRLKIIALLIEARSDLCVCELMDALEASHSNISRHLKILKTAGLVREMKAGKWAYYSLANSTDTFYRHILQAVRNIPPGHFSDEVKRMKLRLSLRERGKCVDGLKSEKWMRTLPLLDQKDISRKRIRTGKEEKVYEK